jgi:signal transduction histidine kinase
MGGIAEDITERKLLEQERIELLTQLQQALHFRNEFISMASHELRTPLTPLKLSLLTLEILNRRGGAGVERETDWEKMLAIALEQVRRLETLTNNLLDVSKIQSERFQIARAELNLSELLETLLAAHRHWAETSGCELRGHIEPGVVGDFDRMRVEQVVVNLLSNAMKYAPGAPIDVSLVRLDGHASITVRDHGPGIGSSFLPKVFEPFSRDSKVRGSTGLGLGLYICRRIAEAHGGIIQATNAEGGGAEFILTLPVRERMQAAA